MRPCRSAADSVGNVGSRVPLLWCLFVGGGGLWSLHTPAFFVYVCNADLNELKAEVLALMKTEVKSEVKSEVAALERRECFVDEVGQSVCEYYTALCEYCTALSCGVPFHCRECREGFRLRVVLGRLCPRFYRQEEVYGGAFLRGSVGTRGRFGGGKACTSPLESHRPSL